MKTIPPHMLRDACEASDTTLQSLSERTGIPEEELRSFDEGCIGLSARDWYAILTELAVSAPKQSGRKLALTKAMNHGCFDQNVEAYRRLLSDVKEEERLEEEEPTVH